MGKVLQFLVTFALFSLFLYTFSIGLKNFLSNKVGSFVTVEYGPKFPDFTFCPFLYNEV